MSSTGWTPVLSKIGKVDIDGVTRSAIFYSIKDENGVLHHGAAITEDRSHILPAIAIGSSKVVGMWHEVKFDEKQQRYYFEVGDPYVLKDEYDAMDWYYISDELIKFLDDLAVDMILTNNE